MGAHDFKYNKAPLFAIKPGTINTSWSAAPKRVSLGLKEVQMGVYDFIYNKVLLFARKPGNINTSRSAAPKLALVPASRYYCDVSWSYHNVCAKFH